MNHNLSSKGKDYFTLKQTMKTESTSSGNGNTLSLTTALGSGRWSTPRPSRFVPGKETRYRLYVKLGGPQELIWTEAENLALTGIRSLTAQPVASRALPSAHIIHILSPCKPACRLCWCSYFSRNMYGFTRPCTSSAFKLLG
jgi:hypothetical protein